MGELTRLDAIDRRILAELQSDATISFAELSTRVGASSASCWRRVHSLEQAGVFVRTVRLVNQATLGRAVNVMCNVRMRSHDVEAWKSFEEFVDTHPEVMECFSMSGDWDYLLRIVAKDVEGYNEFLMRQLLSHPSVDGASSHFVLSTTKYTTAVPT